jgi:hypothetical protein
MEALKPPADLEKKLRAIDEKQGDALKQARSDMRDKKRALYQGLENTATKEYDLKINNVSLINEVAPKGLPAVNNFAEAVFATEEGEISDLLESDDAKTYALARVDSIKEKGYKEFDEVKDLVEVGFNAQKKAEQLVITAKNLKEDLDANKTTFAEFASKNGVQIKQKSGLTIKSNFVSPEFVKEIFNLKTGAYTNMSKNNEGAIVIAKATGVNQASSPAEMEMFSYKSKVQEQVSQEIMAQYLDYLKEKYSVNVYSE